MNTFVGLGDADCAGTITSVTAAEEETRVPPMPAKVPVVSLHVYYIVSPLGSSDSAADNSKEVSGQSEQLPTL